MAVLPLLAAGLLIGGCAKDTVRYGDAKGVETVTNQFGSTDLQMIAESMTRSLLNSAVRERRQSSGDDGAGGAQQDQRIHRYPRHHRQHSHRAAEERPGALRESTRADMQQQVDELKRQQSELYEKNKAAQVGKMVGATYRLEGNIISIVKQANDVKDVYYKFNLQLWNIDNGLMEWGDEKEIRKTTTKG
jgi:PBP1b-binding outer membrane lipoprotein LpoB